MNMLIFLGGAGTGAFIATMLFLILIRAVLRKSSASTQEMQEINRRSVDALEVRNEIGKDHTAHLRTIAGWCEDNPRLQPL